MTEDESFAAWARRLRDAHGLTLRDFGALVGVHWTSVWQWEHGRAEARAGLVRRRLAQVAKRAGMGPPPPRSAPTKGEGEG